MRKPLVQRLHGAQGTEFVNFAIRYAGSGRVGVAERGLAGKKNGVTLGLESKRVAFWATL